MGGGGCCECVFLSRIRYLVGDLSPLVESGQAQRDRQRQIWDSALASLSGQSREDWNETLQKLSTHGPQGVLGFGEDFDADVAVAMRLADFVLEGPAAIGLKRTDPEAVPQRMYTSDYDSASGAEEHEEAAAATASPTTHST